MPESGSVWQWFGFRKNPYDFQALGVDKEDRSLFVGRDREIPRLATPIASDYGGITVVEGRVGVGKTSFVNAVQYDEWERTHALPSFQVLQVQRNTDSIGFVLSAFSTCIGSLELTDPTAANKDKDLRAGKAMVAQMLNSGWSFSGGLNVGLAGGQVGAGKSAAPSSPLLPALPMILQTSGKWFDAAKRLGWSKFIVPVNNLDMLDDDSVVDFLNITRDYMISLSKKGVWWVLIAREGFVHMMEGRAHRVSEVFTGPPVQLDPMSLDDVQKAINARMKKFAAGDHDEPVPREVVKWLYDLSGGEVRAIFKKLTDLVYEYHATVPSAKTVPTNIAKSILVGEARRRLQELGLQKKWVDILNRSVAKGGTRLGDFKVYGFNSKPALSYAVQRLCALGLLRKSEKGREVLYIPTTDANLAFQDASNKPSQG